MLAWSSVVVVQLDNVETGADVVGATVLINENVVVPGATFPRHLYVVVRDVERTGWGRRLRNSIARKPRTTVFEVHNKHLVLGIVDDMWAELNSKLPCTQWQRDPEISECLEVSRAIRLDGVIVTVPADHRPATGPRVGPCAMSAWACWVLAVMPGCAGRRGDRCEESTSRGSRIGGVDQRGRIACRIAISATCDVWSRWAARGANRITQHGTRRLPQSQRSRTVRPSTRNDRASNAAMQKAGPGTPREAAGRAASGSLAAVYARAGPPVVEVEVVGVPVLEDVRLAGDELFAILVRRERHIREFHSGGLGAERSQRAVCEAVAGRDDQP